jgi:benzil reductase ((S)-benzoin forming)
MHIYVTGVSKGLGKEFVEYFLTAGHLVTGIGRSHSFDYSNFNFIHCDLSNVNEVKSVKFDSKENEVVLINNAGVIGNIQRVSDQHESDIQEVMTVNTISPMILCQEFLRQTALEKTLTIINISSGAANRPIPSWAAYCSSKIAMDRFSETIYLEEQEKGRNIKVFAVAPGVVDTSMQKKIRTAKKVDFSGVDNFKSLHDNGELLSTTDVVNKLVMLISLKESNPVIFNLKELD